MEAKRSLVITFGVVLLAIAATEAKRGIIMTVPTTWVIGRDEKVCINFHDINFDVNTTTIIKQKINDESSVHQDKSVRFHQGTDGCFTMKLGGDFNTQTWSKPVLKFNATGLRAGHRKVYSFADEVKISVKENVTRNITFIETDRPLYKPGDMVKFRVLTIQEELKPRLENIPLIYVENPGGVRMMQWMDIQVTDLQGLAEFSMQLSSDPTLGEWKIIVQRKDGNKKAKMFKIEEYVLPKFEVVVKPPAYILVSAESVQAEVCAQYTYGEPVKGNLNVSMCMKTPYYYYDKREFVCHTLNIEIDGCHFIDLPIQTLLGDETHDYYGLYVQINASVEEDGTGVHRNVSIDTTSLGFKLYNVEFIDTSSYFKPGLPYRGKILVTTAEGKPVSDVKVNVTRQNTKVDRGAEAYTTDTDGLIHFVWSEMEMKEKRRLSYIMIQADVPVHQETGNFKKYSQVIQEASASFSVKSWYSPSDSYIVIDQIPKDIDCGGNLQAHVAYTPSSNSPVSFFIKVTVQYSIVWEGESSSTESESGRSLDVSLPYGIWGEAHLLVYYVRGDGEIVADSAKFVIGHCIKNQVEMQFTNAEVSPGQSVDLELTAAPNSLCAYGVVDKSVKLLGGDSSLSMKKVVSDIPTKTPSSGSYSFGDEYCRIKMSEENREEKEPKRKRQNRRHRLRKHRGPRSARRFGGYGGHYFSNYVDASEAFKVPGISVLSDLTLDTRPCEERILPPVVYMSPGIPGPGGPAGRPMFKNERQHFPKPEAFDYSIGMELEADITSDSISSEKEVDTVRSFFPETWLWDIVPIGPEGSAVLSKKAPDTITEWVGHAVCTNKDKGIGVSPPISLKTFQPFFVSFTLPYSVIRGETLYMPVSVFNYLTECLVIKLELMESDGYHRSGSGASSSELCVCGHEKKTHIFPVTATTLGHVNVTVKAESVENALVCDNMIMSSQIGVSDTVIRELLVEAEGKEEEFAFSSFICPAGASIEETTQLHLPRDLVPDSARGYVSVMGDVMGPALSGLESLLRLPTGCGEQTMLSFAPNIYILKYLTNTDQVNEKIEKLALDFLHTGYQRELGYRHSDGSYSAFGKNDDSGSTWLTAFVLKSFSQAKDFIDIDDHDLHVTRDWFVDHQMENGCFQNVGRIIHKSMKGGLSSNQTSPAPLTAYSLVAVIEAGYGYESPVVKNAVKCLSNQVYSDTYSTALVAYAYSLWDPSDPLTVGAMEKLNNLKTEHGGMTFWSHTPSSDRNHHIKAADVETTAYALLAYLNTAANPLNELTEMLPIVKWLTAQRNPNGGFLSTQDTVVALQALAEFATITGSGNSEVRVVVKAKQQSRSFSISDNNRLLLQREPLEVPNDITFEVSGNGCAFVQASMLYNVLNVSDGSTPSIHIDINPSRTEDKNCRRRKLNICIRYEGPDDQTNMALLDVKMVTGWVPVKETVQKLIQDTTLNLGRYEMEKKNVYLYFNELMRQKQVCLSFEVEEEVEVRNAKPGSATVYDYYDQKEVFFQKEYRLQSICGTKEELPFGPLVKHEDADHVEQQREPLIFPGEVEPESEESEESEETADTCPICYNESIDLKVLKKVFCSAQHAYKGMVKKPGQLKIRRNMIKNKKMNVATKVVQPESCSCETLQTRAQWVWVVSETSEIQTTQKKKGILNLAAGDIVIPVTRDSKILSKLMRKTKKSKKCRGN